MMRLYKRYELSPDEIREALAEWLSKRITEEINPKNILDYDRNEINTHLIYVSIENMDAK